MSRLRVIKDVDIIKPDKILNSYDIKFSDKIIAIEKEIETNSEHQIIDGSGYYLSPGFIDLHMHGSFGIDIMSAGKEDLKEMADGLTKAGTTSILPTVMTASVKRMENAVKNIQKVMKEENNIIKGINLEGPLLNPTKAGAQDKRYMKALNLELFDKYKEIIKIVTVAPEVEGATALLNKLNSLNIVSAMGHTDASYEESLQGFKKGISLVTHLFNGMNGSQSIGNMTYSKNCGVIIEQLHKSIPNNIAVIINGNHADIRTLAFGNHLPGNNISVMFNLGEQNLISFINKPVAKTVGNEVNRIRCSGRVDNFIFMLGIDEFLHFFSCQLVSISSLLAKRMDTAVNICMLIAMVRMDAICNTSRHLTRSCIIQINQSLSIYLLG